MEALKKVFSANRNLILVTFFSLVSTLLIIVFITAFSHEKTYSKNVEIESHFCDGHDWNRIDNLPINESDKMQLKGALLRVTIESSALSGFPMMTSSAGLTDYVQFVDKFYKINENIALPLFFALKLADLAKSGSDDITLTTFRLTVTQKLKNYGLMQ